MTIHVTGYTRNGTFCMEFTCCSRKSEYRCGSRGDRSMGAVLSRQSSKSKSSASPHGFVVRPSAILERINVYAGHRVSKGTNMQFSMKKTIVAVALAAFGLSCGANADAVNKAIPVPLVDTPA